MVKPRKKRNVLYPPRILYFKPQGIPLYNLDEVILTVDEYEAIRLSDYRNLKQEEAAKMMNISRPTFTRLIDNARKKISDAIVNGKAIRIEGGSFVFLKNRIRCVNCGNVWETESKYDSSLICPSCESNNIEDMGLKLLSRKPGRRWRGGKW